MMQRILTSPEAEQSVGSDGGAEQIYAEQVRYLYHLSRPAYFGSLINAGIITLALSDIEPRARLMGWLGGVLTVTLMRYLLYRSFLKKAPDAKQIRPWARRFLIGVGAMGVLWGALGTLLYPAHSVPHQFLVIFLVAGMSGAAMIVLAPLREAILTFVTPALLPLIVMVFLQGTLLHYFMGVLILVFLGVMLGGAPIISGMISESLHIKYENSGLIRRLSEAHAQSERVNVQLSEHIAGQQHTAEQLRQASQKFKALINASPLAIVVRDAGGMIERWNPAAERIFGWSEAEVLGRSVAWYPSGEEEEKAAYNRSLISRGIAFSDVEAVRKRKDGTLITVSISGAPVYDQQENALGVLVMLADITERKRVAQRQELQAEITRVLAESSAIEEALVNVIQAICGKQGWSCGARWAIDKRDNTLRCEAAWGIDVPAVQAFVAVSRSSSNPMVENPGGSATGVVRQVWSCAAPVWVADVQEASDFRRIDAARHAGLHSAIGFPVMIGEDFYGAMEFYAPGVWPQDRELMNFSGQIGSQIGQFLARKQAESNLQFMATHDVLTALPNRKLFDDRLTQALSQANRYHRQLALLFIDLDGFKSVNDTYGHGVGDVLLKAVAGRLRSRLREGDVIGRIGGDEFVVMIEEHSEREELEGLARKIVEVVALPMVVQGQECQVTASVGISTYPQDGRESQTLLKNADLAMYRAKEQGKNRFQFYSI